MDLFSLILQSAVGWGVGRALDVVANCFKCGQPTFQDIGNVQSNEIYCKNCHCNNMQFTNACEFTVNKRTLEIGQGAIAANQKWRWSGGFFDNKLIIPHSIRTVGLNRRDLILKTEVRGYDSEELVATHSSVLTPNYDNCHWNDYWHSFGRNNFENISEKIFSVDSILLSEYKDVISEDRRIITPFK